MKTKQILFIILSLFLIMGLDGCEKNRTDETTIFFKNTTTNQAQKLVEGKWKIVKQFGGVVGSIETDNSYIEYKNHKVTYFSNNDTVRDIEIEIWSINSRGCQISFEDSSIVLLETLTNDTLLFSNGKEDFSVFSWIAIKNNN